MDQGIRRIISFIFNDFFKLKFNFHWLVTLYTVMFFFLNCLLQVILYVKIVILECDVPYNDIVGD